MSFVLLMTNEVPSLLSQGVPVGVYSSMDDARLGVDGFLNLVEIVPIGVSLKSVRTKSVNVFSGYRKNRDGMVEVWWAVVHEVELEQPNQTLEG